jgi:hypothetical protein
MGTVTNLQEYRNKRSLDTQPRPMTHEEWIDYLNSPDYEGVGKAIGRCLEIRDELTGLGIAALIGDNKHYRFSHAFHRCTLRVELAGLVEKYDLALFKAWI